MKKNKIIIGTIIVILICSISVILIVNGFGMNKKGEKNNSINNKLEDKLPNEIVSGIEE